MSRELPRRPNLEHLKNQAKDLLADRQRHDPDSKLADALHAVARDYGFTSWPKLKAHIEAPSPFAGTWIANLSKSKRHPANPFRSATLAFDVAGDAVTITHSQIDESGRETRGTHTLHPNGDADPSAGTEGYALTARWRDSHVLETEATKDGQIVGRGTYVVSADGLTLTITSTDASANAQGWQSDVEQVIVLDRQH